ncbi:MAG TPA: DUF3592 domain-containing protein [Steroidobacteraceae bacterium]|nr:DUF3592 domain-containing protein [Steroidobacteraceae bacterium]
MKELVGRLIGYVFVGSFCIAGPVLLILALCTAVQRCALVISGARAEATVIGAVRASGSTGASYAPVFRFTARDARSYTISSDVYGKESAIRYGQRLRVLYSPNHPESARMDAFASLWTMPLVVGAVGAAFCVVPAVMLVAWVRRRADVAEPDKRKAAHSAADAVSRRLRRALGLVLIGAGSVLLAIGLGVVSTDSSVNGSRMLPAILGLLLIASGVQVGQWVGGDGRVSDILGSVVAACMAVMFGWVAIYGDAANFHGGMSVGPVSVALNGPAALARMLFAVVATLAGLYALWIWKRVFRSR